VRIEELDPADEALTRRFWEVAHAAWTHGRPWAGYRSWAAARSTYTSPSSTTRRVLLAGSLADGRPVAAAELTLPLLDNPRLAFLEVYVDPPHQARGHGTALARHALERVRDEGRELVSAEVPTPLAGPPSPGLRLARGLGFTTGVVEEDKVVDLDATAHLWPQLLAETEPTSSAYSLRSWADVCPDELVAGYCRLLEAFNEQAPTGSLEVEPERWTEQRLREKEERFRRAGRTELTTVALAGDGEVVGLTETMVEAADTGRAFQGATLVLPGHRGHRLGLRLKATQHRLLRRRFPECRTVLTGNADVNGPMNAVNRRLGYRPVELVHEMQLRLTA
jgi:GNAT superfamily N-acetyltransferase